MTATVCKVMSNTVLRVQTIDQYLYKSQQP